MSDRMTKEQRHHCMNRVRSRDTKPEWMVRRCLWHHGFRYRLYDKRLPGRPDIVLRKWNTVIFINGGFWHGHDCEKFKMPQTNEDFWKSKIERNQKRDQLNRKQLTFLGYHVITIWECELAPAKRAKTLESLLYTLSQIIINHHQSKHYRDYDEAPSLAAEP